MNIQQLIAFAVGGGLALLAYVVDRMLPARQRPVWRWIAAAAIPLGFFIAVDQLIDNRDRAINWTKLVVALAAAFAVFYETARAGMRRPVSERWKKFIGVTLAAAAIGCYFTGFRFGYPKYYHRWDQFHYYMGAKYFREMGYDGLYKCSVIAEDELGTVVNNDESIGPRGKYELSKEVRHADKKICNLVGDNLLI